MNLCDELTIRMLLERHGFHFSKSMGQNFLIDPQIPADIAAASQADETCGVLEIGPGIGPLTSELAQRAGKVVSIELDRALLPILAETMAPHSNVEIVPGDVTRLDLKALIGEKFAGLRPIVCANLPYNITTPVLTALVDIPAIVTVVNDRTDFQARVEAGADIFNVAAGPDTPELVRKIRKELPDFPLIATGGPTEEFIRETIQAGANAISWTPPPTASLFKESMAAYREDKPHP